MRTIGRTRRGITGLALCSLLLGSGCFGNFAMTRGVHHFNRNLHPNRWVQWGTFLGFNVIPIYEGAILIDAVIVNTVQFWTGQNPAGQVAEQQPPAGDATARAGERDASAQRDAGD
jgi:hypothetical protein